MSAARLPDATGAAPHGLTRRQAAALGAASLGVLAVACSTRSATPPASQTQTSVQGKSVYLYHGSGGPQFDQYLTLAERFMQRYPQVEMEIVPIPQGQTSRVKLLTMVAAGDPPDTAFTENWNLAEYVEKNVIQPLDPFVSRDRYDLKRFFDSTIALCRVQAEGQNKLFALPRHPSPLVLFYNPERFAAHGIKPPDATWTWDSMLDAARRLTSESEWGAWPPYSSPTSCSSWCARRAATCWTKTGSGSPSTSRQPWTRCNGWQTWA
jgi:ABC-type glycerol-3-phosphate transport system substrate-binding protein